MANKYCNLTGTNKIKDEYTLINDGFELVENDMMSGSPAGVYANLAALTIAFPDGDNRVYVTTDNGNWNYWNGSAWVAGGLYQSPLTDSPANTIKGNNTGATAPVKDLTVAQTKALLDIDDLEDQLNSVPISDTSYGLIKAFENAETAVMQNLLIKGLTATQLAENGNFDGDYSGWTASNIGTPSVADNTCSFTATATNGEFEQSNINYITGHTYYVSAWVYSDSSSVVMVCFNLGTRYKTVAHGGTGWELLSWVGQTVDDAYSDIFSIRDNRTSGWTQIKVKDVIKIDLTAHNIASYDLATCQSKFPSYFDGTISVDKGEVSVIGKNLFDKTDGNIIAKYIGTGGVLLDSSAVSTSGLIPVIVGQSYIRSGFVTTRSIRFLDTNLNILQYGANNPQTAPLGSAYLQCSFDNSDINTFQLELGSTATTYAPYNVTRARYPKLQSVPAITDTFNVLTGLHTQNVQRYVLTEDDIVRLNTSATNLDWVIISKPIDYIWYNVSGHINGAMSMVGALGDTTYSDSIAKIGYIAHTGLTEFSYLVAKGTYADITAAKTALTGTVIYYQLATPILSYYPPKSIPLEIGSSIIHQSIMSDIVFYSTGIAISDTDYPINSLQEVFKVDEETGAETPIDIATCTVAVGGLTFTSTALTDGDLVWFRYEHTLDSAVPTTDYTYTTSLAGGLSTIQQDTKKQSESLQKQIDELRAIIASMAV